MKPACKIILTLLTVSMLAACSGGSGGSDSSPDTGQTGGNTPGSGSGSGSGGSTPNEKSLLLSWSIPTTRSDGSPLQMAEIGGYEIYYFLDGSSQDNDNIVTITSPQVTEYETPSLSPGTYYFAISTFDSEGIYSELSPTVSIDIN